MKQRKVHYLAAQRANEARLEAEYQKNHGDTRPCLSPFAIIILCSALCLLGVGVTMLGLDLVNGLALERINLGVE